MLSMIPLWLVVLDYCSYRTNSKTMAATTTTVSNITKVVRGRMEIVLLDAIVGKSTLNSMRHIVE